MSTHPAPLSLESKRAQIIAARNLLDDALKNVELLINLPDHLPTCTCGSVTHAISDYRETQWAELEAMASQNGVKLFTMGSAPAGITYIAHVEKWRVNRKFRKLDDLDDWLYAVCYADSVAMSK